VALDAPRLALLLLAVEPRLRGVAFAGAAGSGKSALLHGLRALLPDLPFEQLPSGADDEALLGGLDLEATIARGARVVRAGLLARADGGVLAVEDCNLLPESAANQLLGALDSGELNIERDGLSLRSPCRMRLVATFDPAEGTPRAHLLDRLGMIVALPRPGAAAARAEVVRRHLRPAEDLWQEDLEMLRDVVATARDGLADVRLSDAQARELAAASLAFGVQGHRADLFAQLAARASAALALRDRVEREDLEVAVRFVLAPRATQRPETAPPDEPAERTPPPPTEPERNAGADETPPEPPEQTPPPPDEDELQLGDEVLAALATDLPDVLSTLPFRAARGGRSGSRGSTDGKRGRHIASVPGSPREGRLDVIATLRVAARWQRLRPPPTAGRRIAVRADDLRIRRYRDKAGALFLFAVDASGSMALNRMRQAKGAVHALLERAYVNRDRVALMSFRGQGAELLLPPTGSVELLRRAVDQIPTGGGTPLAATLVAALDVAQQARRRGLQNVVLVLLTDARANVGLKVERAGVQDELRQVATAAAATGLKSLVIDTQRSYLSQGSARQLASWLGGQYLYLPGADGKAIAAAAQTAA
ncbi:MAG: magnesium chelatase ATPase subunit D, partial [Gammaproteobacteria bacterium]|nr:magnesium chelatase ATPase subunit D [Gammaproteobacteria bacterium]